MTKQFKIYFKINFAKQAQYRSAALSGTATQIFFGFMQIMVFMAFLGTSSSSGFSIPQMSSYIWLRQVFYPMFIFYNSHHHILSQILNGDISYGLIKPVKMYNQWFYDMYSSNVAKVFFRAPILLLVVLLLPAGWGLMLPAGWINLLLFILSFLISSVLIVTISIISYTIVTMTLSAGAVFGIVNAVASLFAGQIVPLPLFPMWFQKLANFFPFRYVVDLPFRIYVGSIDPREALMFIGIQVLWLVALMIFGKFFVKKRTNKLVVQGG